MCTLDRIIKLLNERGFTQKQLTDYLGITKNVFTDWKSGKNKSYTKHLPKIAKFLGVTVDNLIGGTFGKTDEYHMTTYVNVMEVDVDGKKEKIMFTRDEMILIKCFRQVDQYGKDIILAVARQELDRYLRSDERISSLVAARSVNGNEPIHIDTLPDMSKVPVDDTDI